MAVNKVQRRDGTVEMDISDTTATPEDVALGEVFYDKSGVKRSGTGNYMDKVSNPTADDILVTDANGQAVDSGIKTSDIKGDARVDIFDTQDSYSASIGNRTDGTAITFNEAKSDGRVSGHLFTDTPFELAKQGELEGLQSQIGTLTDLTTTEKSNLVGAINEVYEKSGEPFRVKQWGSNALNVEIPTCTEDISNTAIPKMVFSIDDVEGAAYQIVGMIAYEIFDAASGGNRINCWPVCQFTGNGQKELSVRWMCGGTTRKTARRINAWVLLKHR